MRIWHRLRELLRTLFRGHSVSRDLDAELDDWVQTLAARHRARGAGDAEARRLALIELGGLTQVKQEARAVRNGAELDSTAMDVRYALRALRRAPAFTAAAVLTFALGIGATTAIFSVVKIILIEPLPYRDADRLAFLWADLTDLGYPHAPLSGPELAEFQQRATSFERWGGVWATNATLAGIREPEQLRIATVTPDFFGVLGVEPALGEVLSSAHFGQPVTPVLLSHALWSRTFGGDPGAVGRSVTLNDRPARIVGVMPRDFELLFPPDAAIPTDLQAWIPGSAQLAAQPRGQQYLRVVGRVRPDVPMSAAVSEVAAIGAGVIAAHPGSYTPGSRFYAVDMQEDNVRPLRPAMLAMFAGVLLLLVIACVNIAGLLILRASHRRRETSLRLALGASQSRLLRQCLVEGLVLAALGGAAGVIAAHAGVRLIIRLAPSVLPRIQQADLDAGVLTFAAAASAIWGLAFSLIPWLEIRRVDLIATLQHGGRMAGGRGGARLRSALVVAQVALGVVLTVGAALLARTFWELVRVDPGFRADRALTFRVSPPFQRYRPTDGLNAFHRDLLARLRAVPGVAAVGSVSHLPYDNLPNWATPYLPEGETDGSRSGLADSRVISPGFFDTVGATMIAGREFEEHDARRPALPVVIDDLLAQRLFGRDAAVGRTFQIDPGGSGKMSPAEVIGVVRHLRHRSLTDPGREQLFVSARLWARNPASYVLRTSGDPGSLAAAVRAVVADLDPALPVYDVQPIDAYVTGARAPRRFTMVMAITFAGVALVLAGVGVYGVVAYAVGRRAHEFGIRRALGAAPGAIIRLVLADAGRLAAAGVALGLAIALPVSQWLRSLLFGVTARDPFAYAAALATLGAAMLAASWLPARRAAASPPMHILRHDG